MNFSKFSKYFKIIWDHVFLTNAQGKTIGRIQFTKMSTVIKQNFGCAWVVFTKSIKVIIPLNYRRFLIKMNLLNRRKITDCFFRQIYGKMWIGFSANTRKRLFAEVSFKADRKSIGFFYKMVLVIFKIALCL